MNLIIRDIDTSGFEKFARDMARTVKASSFRDVVRPLVANTLRKCASKTRIAKKSAWPRTGGSLSVPQGTAKLDIVGPINPKTGAVNANAGAVWLSMPPDVYGRSKVKNPYVHYLIKGKGGGAPMRGGRQLRWSDKRWALAQSMLAEAERKNKMFVSRRITSTSAAQTKILGRGLGRLSWAQCGDDLGLSIPGFDNSVRSATTQDGQRPKNGAGAERGSGDKDFYIIFQNRMPILGGARILDSAISSQMKDFTRAVKGGYSADLKYLASHFPGVVVK